MVLDILNSELQKVNSNENKYHVPGQGRHRLILKNKCLNLTN